MTRPMIAAMFGMAVMGSALGSMSVAAADEPTLTIFNWADYLPQDVVDEFEAKHHVRVVQNYYNSNAEMLAKLQSGGDHQYDLAFPSDYFVPRLIKAGLVQPLDGARLTNRSHLLADFRNPSYDPDESYSVPYQWGATGIAYNADALPDLPPDWHALFDPKANPTHPFALLKGDGQFTLSTACAYLNKGYDCIGREDWLAAAKVVGPTLKRANYVGFVGATAALDQLARGVIDVGVVYNGDFARKQVEDPESFRNIRFFIPREGSQRWVDAMVIPAHAPHPELAAAFMNYLLTPEVAARVSNANFYSTPVADAVPLLKPALRDSVATPDEQQRKRLAYTPSLDGQQLQFVQQLWTELRSR
ncbi:ABC transporter substrate-binding protein [Larsenimonas rhizosphaerae]|uniref:Putrescine-binding periplasmic protein n=1 Tax=Larsenimonas rhizosphaerae TaxID=2944682 RepID=A0AA41ZFF4_9GAMM|nr:spermidine/putrescine ABC transporter substrate-binding protein [Larsenimonas rhizosphaerae]MCX2523812.1 spermidine/putrescine ABC transporter substrate-binding protein [Larsenimonas rhizosphaerae]